MSYHGDYRISKVVRFKFVSNSAGVPTTLAGTPALSVYKDASTTESTSGVTLTVDFDSRTGLNHVAIDTSSDGTFYSSGSDFDVVVTAGTIGGVSAVSYVAGSFSLENRSGLMSVTADRKAVVDSNGLIDANVVKVGPTGSGTAQTARDIGTSVLLSSGTGTGQILLSSGKVVVPDTQKVDVDTIKTNPVVNAGTITFPTTATLASTTNITAGTITTTTNLTNAAGAGDFTATMKTSIGTAVAASAVASVTGNVGGSVTGSVGSISGITFPTNFADLSIAVTTGLVNITQSAADKAWATSARTLTAGTNIQLPSNGLANVTAWTVAITGSITGNLSGSVGSVTAAILLPTIPTDWIAAAGVKADAVTKIQSGLSTATAVGTANTGIADIQTRLPDALNGGMMKSDMQLLVGDDAAAAALKLFIQTALQSDGAAGLQFTELSLENAPTGGGTPPTTAEIADKILGRRINGGADGARTVGEALGFLRNAWGIVGTTLTVYQIDDTTAWWTGVVNTDASAIPIVGTNPA